MFFIWMLYLNVHLSGSAANSTSDFHGVKQPVVCRTERRMYLLYDQYKEDTCARCYNYMPKYAFKLKYRYHSWMGLLKNPITNETYEANPFNVSREVFDSFLDESYVIKWKTCCVKAVECCDHMLMTPPAKKDGVYCPRTWDGWQCWDDTPAETTAQQPCPPHIYFQTNPPSCIKYSYKVCLADGTWFLDDNLREWTNYSKCGRGDEYRRFLYFHIATYAISIVFIIPALIIFSIYKQLQVHRITMHKNLFLSLFLNGTVVLLFKAIVVLDEYNRSPTYETIMQQNGGLCKFLFILTKYFRMTNYMWMFCEGFYLHKLIAAAFAEQKNLIMFYVIGWVLPIIPVGIYAILRKTTEDEKCWAFPVENYEWIMNAPNMLSLFSDYLILMGMFAASFVSNAQMTYFILPFLLQPVNFFFLCNIIRVLVTKLRATHSNEPSQYRKAVRATVILVPLFGLQFFLVIYRPQSGHCRLLEAYTYFSHATDGLQGFMVSLFFCYMNSEVIYLIRRSYQRYRISHNFKSQNSMMLNQLSVTQMSTMAESQNACQSGLHYRTKAGDRPGDIVTVVPKSASLQDENTTTV